MDISAHDIIESFGGPAALSRRLGGPSRKTVGMWGQRGRFPWEQHDPLLDLAEELGVPLTRELLRELSTTRKTAAGSVRRGQASQQVAE